MNHTLLIRITIMVILAGLLWTPCTAFKVGDIAYPLGIYSEQDNYTLQNAGTPPDSLDWISGSDTIAEEETSVVLVRHPLVVFPGTSVEMVLYDFITDVPVQYETDLQYPQIFLNNQPVSGTTIMGSGTIMVKGIVPSSAGLDEEVRILSFPESNTAMNSRFLAATTSHEQAMAKANLFAASEQQGTGLFGISKDNFREAISEFSAGNYLDSAIRAQIAMEKGDIKREGVLLGGLIMAVAAVIALVAGWYLGKRKGREIERRPDLLKMESVILQYFDLKIQQKREIPKKCRGMIEKAFVVNTARTELLAALARPGETISSLQPRLKHLPPSLFQAFYEKSRFGKSQEFDDGVEELLRCLQVSAASEEQKHATTPSSTLFRRQ
ncbi:MAG: hypothetical protein KA091_02360 [Methanoregulaceae archaeon]|jgi:hypothetical protein|nr:hypothetical protein [Methanoregulaceae archaeon]